TAPCFSHLAIGGAGAENEPQPGVGGAAEALVRAARMLSEMLLRACIAELITSLSSRCAPVQRRAKRGTARERPWRQGCCEPLRRWCHMPQAGQRRAPAREPPEELVARCTACCGASTLARSMMEEERDARRRSRAIVSQRCWHTRENLG